MIKRLLVSFTFALAVLCVSAQNRVSTYTAQLRMPEASTGAQATVSNDADIASGLQTAPKGDNVPGYRVCIFFDNSQNGRSLANGALGTFRSRFPGIPGEVVYANPTFKTMVGYCMDAREQAALLGRIREIFPLAGPWSETMPISNLLYNPMTAEPDGSLTAPPETAEEPAL